MRNYFRHAFVSAAIFALMVTGQAQAQNVAPAAQESVAPAAAAQPSRRSVVIDALRRHQGGSDRLFVAPHIPAALAGNARAAAQLDPNDDLLGVSNSSGTKNGRIGLYFLSDRIVQHRAPGLHQTIYYEQLQGVTPTQGTFVLRYGSIMIDANLVGKERIQAAIADILAGLAALPPEH